MPARPKGPWLREGRGYYAKVNGRQISLKTSDLSDAWDEFYRLMGKAGLPTTAAGRAPPSVLEVVDRFCVWVARHRAATTAAWHKIFLDDFIARSPLIKNMDATKLRPFHVQEWIDLHRRWTTTTQNRAASTVKRAYSWAVEQGLIEVDPIRALKKAKARRRLRILTPEEWGKVLDACRNDNIRAFMLVQRATGARPQELRAAEIRHFDRRGGCLRFPAEESKGGLARVVMLPPEAIRVVERCVKGRRHGAIFQDTKGGAWTRGGLRSAIRLIVKRCGVKFDAYTLRHSYATDALMNGVDSMTVGILMGHVDPSMVGKVYQHLDQRPEYLKQAAAKASAPRSSAGRKGGKRAAKTPAAKARSKPRPAAKRRDRSR
jgi:integrase